MKKRTKRELRSFFVIAIPFFEKDGYYKQNRTEGRALGSVIFSICGLIRRRLF